MSNNEHISKGEPAKELASDKEGSNSGTSRKNRTTKKNSLSDETMQRVEKMVKTEIKKILKTFNMTVRPIDKDNDGLFIKMRKLGKDTEVQIA